MRTLTYKHTTVDLGVAFPQLVDKGNCWILLILHTEQQLKLKNINRNKDWCDSVSISSMPVPVEQAVCF